MVKPVAIALAAIGALVLQMDDVAAQDLRRESAAVVAPARRDEAQYRRRPRVRIYRSDDAPGVYPRYNPGQNAVRDCTATYVREFRPSGTVITPRMSCFWRQP